MTLHAIPTLLPTHISRVFWERQFWLGTSGQSKWLERELRIPIPGDEGREVPEEDTQGEERVWRKIQGLEHDTGHVGNTQTEPRPGPEAGKDQERGFL